MSKWFRWHHGTVSDPKLALMARKSGQPMSAVIAVWAALLEHASEAKVRGDISGLDIETIAVALDMQEADIHSIVKAMEDKGLISEGRISSWEKRQPIREDGSAERAMRWREEEKAKKNATERKRTETNAKKNKVVRPGLDDVGAHSSEAGGSAEHAESAGTRDDLPVINLPLNNGTEWPVTESLLAELQDLYPAADTMAELRKMRGWLLANPSKRKTKVGINRFIHRWLAKEQDNPSGGRDSTYHRRNQNRRSHGADFKNHQANPDIGEDANAPVVEVL